jgi:cytochrome P450
MEWVLVELIKHPNVMKKAQHELDDMVGQEWVVDENDIPQLKYLQAIVKEAFRPHPLAPILLPHENIKSCEIGNYHIPAKTCIFVNVFAIHKHPSTFKNLLDFNLERFVGSEIDVRGTNFQLLPFGSRK